MTEPVTKRLLTLLEKLEWHEAVYYSDQLSCPLCGCDEKDGHAHSCELCQLKSALVENPESKIDSIVQHLISEAMAGRVPIDVVETVRRLAY